MDTDPQPPDAGAMSQRQPRKRRQSRASTTSARSVTTQPSLDHGLAAAPQQRATFSEQWVANNHGAMQQQSQAQSSHARNFSAGQQMPAEDMMLRPASRMSRPSQSFSMDSNMQLSAASSLSFAPHPAQHAAFQHGLPADSYVGNTSFTDPDSQMMDREDLDEGDSIVAPNPGTRSSSRTSANNELEMRQLFQANRQRDLQGVAKELHGNERGPNSERTRQVFAMLWINQVCVKGKNSVPRGRVYANYASRCANERITVLNPASFGKLVRVLFPGLKTRRLGVRGESKYHYVNFSMIEDLPDIREPDIQPTLPVAEPNSLVQTARTAQSQPPALDIEREAVPPPEVFQPANPESSSTSTTASAHSLYNQPDVSSIDQLCSTTSKTTLRLSLPSEPMGRFCPSEPLVLPPIEPFLPHGTDPDSAMSLTALYRSHCTSLVECVRFCKAKVFFHLYTSFQGTLTMPVQKLFSNPSIAPWIEECDFVLYQRMMEIISTLPLTVIPPTVLETLRNISERLVTHIRDAFQGQPRHVVQAKEAPAAIFSGLLDRALRVNLTAHAAANMLSNPANRDQMYLDWITMVRIRKVAECVPTRGMDDVVNVLLKEIRHLLDPTNVPWDIECQTLYGDLAMQDIRDDNERSHGDNIETMLDRWVKFLYSLSARFPYASSADVVACVQRIGTDVMRDLTIAGGKSFGSWWVTKCWIDEMISFLAEQGGFMQTKNSSPVVLFDTPKQPSAAKEVSQLNHTVADLNLTQISQAQPDRAPFPSQTDVEVSDALHASANHDDSGIGIRTPEDDFPMDKFDYPQGHGHDSQHLDLNAPV